MSDIYNGEAADFGNKLVKLYGLKIFPRMGKVFADMLFQTGVEAGAIAASLEEIYDYAAKANLVTQATVKLNQVAYILGIMKQAGYYTQEEVAEVEEATEELLQNVKGSGGAGFGQPYRM